jgi:hypothetical protein|tara:strand:- start:733 stop:2091 length:1359 start_codon:yes stop_codon:yes gene_type:complete
MESFEDTKNLWLEHTANIKTKKGFEHLVFIIVYPNKKAAPYVTLQWDFAAEKQLQTTLLQTSGGVTGAGTGHNQKLCYLTELNDVLDTCDKYTHAMIVSAGMVFNMVCPTTAIQRFYSWTKTDEFCKGHIIAKPNEKAFIHHQHIELNLNKWRELSKPNIRQKWNTFIRADDNFHDDYTPSWMTPDGLPTITNFSVEERRNKSWAYGHMAERRKMQNKNWELISSKKMGWRDEIDMSDPYFQILFTRMNEVFYAENTESLGKLSDKPFDLIMTPTAGYSGEVFAEKLDFDGEIVFYDYCSENIEIKQVIVDMNMSMDEILLYARNINQIISVNNHTSNKNHRDALHERTKSFGTHEELRILQDEMYKKYDIDYWLMDIIKPDYEKLIKHIKNKKVFFDISNIYGYHISHACYTLDELIHSFNKLIDTLETHTEYYYLKGSNPLKKGVRITNG